MAEFNDEIRVLSVDDEPDFADLVATFVERLDERITVETATRASKALDLLETEGIDCVVSDFDMPGMNGIEFLEAVRAEYPDLPFILYTGKGSEEVASEAISAGVTDYLQKGGGTEQYTILANRILNYVDRTRAQREREYMRERMELALKHTDSVIYEIDLDTGGVTRLGNYELFFDLPSDDVPTWEEHTERAVHPADRDDFRQFYQQLVDGERQSGTIEYRTNPEEGDVRWIRDVIAAEENGVRRALGLAQDVTEHKKHVQKREQLISRVTDAIVEVDADWRFTLINEKAEDLYDMDEEELLGNHFWDVFADAQDTRFEEEYRRVMDTREPSTFVEYYAGLDGWYDVQVYPNENGGLSFYFREVTDRMEREHDLHLMEQIVQEMNDGAVIVQDGVIKYTNPRVSDLVGYGEEDLKEMPMTEFIAPEYQDLVEQRHIDRTKGAQDDPPGIYEIVIVSDTGQRIPVEINVARIEYDGAPATLSLVRDITDRKEREEQLQRQNERLEGFASMVSHDLRTPLNVAQGRIALAKEECDTKHLDDAATAVDRSLSLIDDLLTLAREGEHISNVEPVELARHAESCWQTVETGNATLVTETEQTIPADSSRLKQVFENLIKNAVEHGGEGVTITIGDLKDGFYVADDGPGIPADERPRIFDFGHTTKHQGTGYGLAIVQEIVDDHGWEIQVTDSEDGGARFEISNIEPS